MHRALIVALVTIAFSFLAHAGDVPQFSKDEEADAWLRKNSPFYAQMAAEVDSRGGCKFRTVADAPRAGELHFENGQRYIVLGADLHGPERVSVMAFEMTNAYQERKHQEIDSRARTGAINDPAEFGLLHELVEYDGLRLHRQVLSELDEAIGGIPKAMLDWINPSLTTLANYELPFAFAYMEAQAKSGHTAHYQKWFWMQRAMKD